jgi:hypothetical protein
MKKRAMAVALASAVISACTSANRTAANRSADDTGSDSGGVGITEEMAMAGTVYEPGRRFGRTYCSPCHAQGGLDPKRAVAYPAFHVDTYDDWAVSRTILLAVVDKWNPDGSVMPPPDAVEPPDAERKLILDWVRRGSPNTPSGY